MNQRSSSSGIILGAVLALAAGKNVEAQPLQENSFGSQARAELVSNDQPDTVAQRTVVHPKISSESFFSPDSGWQTCDRAAQSNAGTIERLSRVAYQKFYWDQIETAPGRYDFSLIDAALQDAHAHNQKLDLRPLMPYAPEEGPPKFLKEMGAPGELAVYDDGDSRQQFWIVDLNDAGTRKILVDLIKALGARYDTDTRLGMVDISIFGLWGEGHIGEVSAASEKVSKESQAAFAAKYALTPAARKELIDAYFEAFPSKQKVAQITDVEGLKYAISRGAGIRFDCFGGYYMEHSVYLQNLKAANAFEVWKTAPVVAEICGTLGSWVGNWGSGERQYNESVVQQILDRGLNVYHLTSINAKNGDNGEIPAKLAPQFQKFLGKLGYRFEVSEASFQSLIQEGESLSLSLQGSNTGVAPCYNKNYVWAVQLQGQDGKVLSTFVSERSVAGILPGQFKVDAQVPVKDIAPGTVTIAIGIVDKTSPKPSPVARLAIEGERGGWYAIGSFERQ